MSITLRTLKGSALTYEEMDANLSQYFYSSSIQAQGTVLRLHYTGSDSLDTGDGVDYGPDRYQDITLGGGGGGGTLITVQDNQTPSNTVQEVSTIKFLGAATVTQGTASGIANVTITAEGGGGGVPGGPTTDSAASVQYKVDNSTFGGDDYFYYNPNSKYLGIGTSTPVARLHIVGDTLNPAVIRLEAGITRGINTAKQDIYSGNTKLGSVGKVWGDSYDLLLSANRYDPIDRKSYNKIHLVVGPSSDYIGTGIYSKLTATTNGVGILNTDPQLALDVSGQMRGKYSLLNPNTTNLSLHQNKVVKVQYTGNQTLTSQIGEEGVEATVIIQGLGDDRAKPTITFNSSVFATTGTQSLQRNKFYTICFVSDGVRWYETSRSVNMA